MQWFVRHGHVEGYDKSGDAPVLRRTFVPGQDDAVPPYEEYLRESLLRNLAMLRTEHERAGIDTSHGRIATDRESQTLLAAALQFVNLKPGVVVPWKLASGEFVDLDVSTLREIAGLVGDHVTWCFDNERRIAGALRAAETEDALNGVDMTFL
jgi:hypothetical protein